MSPASNGQWSVTSQELADRNYDLSVEIRSQQGAIIKQAVKRVTIDGTAPTLDVFGVFNGIDWLPSDQVKAQLTDSGSGLLNVTYQVDSQSPIGWTGTNGTWTKSAGDLLNWNDTNQQGVHTLTLKALDKAGNEQKQTIGFSVTKPLIWLDTDVWTDDGALSNPSQPDGLTAPPPAGSGGSGGGMAQYGWGADGRWGYSYGGSWYSSGISDPQSLIGTPWLPSGGNLHTELMTYRGRLQEILKTAIAVIPNTSVENQTKRAALKNRMSLLIEAGAYLNGDSEDYIYYGYEGGSFSGNHYWQDKFFHGSLRAASERSLNTVAFGVALARDLMMGSDSVRLLTFQTLVETTIGAAHLATNDFGPSYTDEIQQSARELAKTYGLLKPQGTVLTGRFAWLDKLWDLTETPSTSGTAIRQILFGNNRYGTGGIVREVVAGMNELEYDYNYNRDAGIFQLLQMSDRLLKSASTIGSWRSDLETTEFTQALLNFGYQVVKVHPTVDSTNQTEVSTWVETLLEGGDVRMAAAGLSDFLSGVVVRDDRIKTLEYADRLVKVADAVDDSRLDSEVLKASTLSQLLNLGGAYSSLNPVQGTGEIYNNVNLIVDQKNMASGPMFRFLNNLSVSNYSGSYGQIADDLEGMLRECSQISSFLGYTTQSLSEYNKKIKTSSDQNFLKNTDYVQYFIDYTTSSAILAGVFDRPPKQGPASPLKCSQLLWDIVVQLIGGITEIFPAPKQNISRGMNERYWQLKADRYGLYKNNRSLNNPLPGIGSWQGHVDAYEQLRGNLNKLLEAWDRENCDDSSGSGGLPAGSKESIEIARKWANIQAPSAPDSPSNQFNWPSIEIPDWFFGIPEKLLEPLRERY